MTNLNCLFESFANVLLMLNYLNSDALMNNYFIHPFYKSNLINNQLLFIDLHLRQNKNLYKINKIKFVKSFFFIYKNSIASFELLQKHNKIWQKIQKVNVKEII